MLLVEEVNATLGSEVMLDMWATVTKLKVINSPGVAGAVLQTASSVTD